MFLSQAVYVLKPLQLANDFRCPVTPKSLTLMLLGVVTLEPFAPVPDGSPRAVSWQAARVAGARYVAPGQLLRQRRNNLLTIFRPFLVEKITPNPPANLPVEQSDRGINSPGCSRARLLDKSANVFEQIAGTRGGWKFPGFCHQFAVFECF